MHLCIWCCNSDMVPYTGVCINASWDSIYGSQGYILGTCILCQGRYVFLATPCKERTVFALCIPVQWKPMHVCFHSEITCFPLCFWGSLNTSFYSTAVMALKVHCVVAYRVSSIPFSVKWYRVSTFSSYTPKLGYLYLGWSYKERPLQ